MLKYLPVLLPLALMGCVTEQRSALPMALAPGDTAQAACLTYDGVPAFGDCQGPEAITVPPAAN